ncbi:MAG TPA: hypothetical protein VFE78_33950 [Gemmataceae bacterium]|nr:hypothetical protein [Gemmataceae bacterium]
MRRRPWIVLWPVALFAGCAPAPTAPPPPLDAAAPARTETASFGLG